MNNKGFLSNKIFVLTLFILPLFVAFSQFVSLVNAKDDWDKSSLSFKGSCSAGCSKVEAEVCNTGDKDMKGTADYQVWYISSGNPKDGSSVGSGTIPALKANKCTKLSFNPQANGNYMFKAFQRPGHPGEGILWSDSCEVKGCSFASPTPTATATVSPTPVITPTPMVTPTVTPTVRPTITPTPVATPDCDDDDCCDGDCCDDDCCDGDCPTQTPTASSTPTVAPTATPTLQPSATPESTATPEPSSSSTPSPDSGKHSSLNKNGPNCENIRFEVTFDLKEDGRAIKDVEVTIDYRGMKQTHKTNEGGRVQVFYDYSGEGDILATAHDNFPSQSLHIDPLDCPSTGTGGAILGTSTGGQVLGTTTDTLGATGVFTDSLIRMIAGFIFGMVGYMGMRSTLAKNVFK